MPMTKSQRDDIKQCLLDCLSDKDFMSILADKVAEVVGSTLGDHHLSKLEGQVSELQGQVAVNQKEIGNLKRKLNYFEQNQKLKHLRLYGLKEEENENLIERVQDTFSKVMKIEKIPIENCYRVGMKNVKDQKPKPVLMQYISINARRELFLQKKT
ncbi:hypothetical protein WA026_021392 [Henosepilachna vigintioctopunctata]|uniref:Uncharacterized protein n=1 Tax=Henosepilachna vigintioctopunctata TaxID=420089 RepID=A0AAW1TXP9_9CUCU